MESLTRLFYEIIKVDFLIRLSLTLVSTVLLLAVLRMLLLWLARRFEKTWLEASFSSLRTFSTFVVLTYGISSVFLDFFKPTPELISPEQIKNFRNLIFLMIFIFAANRFKTLFFKGLENKVGQIKSVDKSLIYAANRISSIAIFVLGTLIALDSIGVPIKTLLAFGGIGGAAIAWASKDFIANFFGGLMIFINRPFMEGNWIVSPNKNFEGVVEHIGWYRTQIRTFERRPAYIPNSLMIDAIITNPGRMYNRRIKETIGLRYEDIPVVDKVIEDIRSMLRSHAGIDQEQTLMVHFLSYASYSLDINIYCFTKTRVWAEYRDVQQDVLLLIAKIVKNNGADFAFPTNTLYTPDLSSKQLQGVRPEVRSNEPLVRS